MYKTPWREIYKKRLKSGKVALRHLKSGRRIFIGSGCAEPGHLVELLSEVAGKLSDADVVQVMSLGTAPYLHAELKNNFRHSAFFVGPEVKKAIDEQRADYTPIYLSEVPRLFQSGMIVNDVALVQVATPDDHGFCSLGVSVDVVKSAAENAKYVIAQVNPRMPRTLGDSFIHVSKIDAFVEIEEELGEFDIPEPDEIALAIGRNVARLIPDGATLQTSAGPYANGILQALTEKNDLGIHTGVFADSLIDLIESGVVTNMAKSLHAGKVITATVMGTRRLFDFVDNNPMVEFHPSDYTNDPLIIARNDNMIGIAVAEAIDLTGQVATDAFGHAHYTGVGGQVDFLRGAARSSGGKPIVIVPSASPGSKVSHIMPELFPGAGVVASRADVHYVVTEFGIAYLYGKSIRERAMAIARIAHPDFRRGLYDFAVDKKVIFPDQVPPDYGIARYEDEWETSRVFDGIEIFFRPILPTDKRQVKEMFYALSEKSVYYRYLAHLKSIPREKLQALCNVDGVDSMGIVGLLKQVDHKRIIAIARYERDPATNLAECDFLVHDDFQRKGIGGFLVEYLMEIAGAKGLAGFTASAHTGNRPMLHLFSKKAPHLKSLTDEGMTFVEFSLYPDIED